MAKRRGVKRCLSVLLLVFSALAFSATAQSPATCPPEGTAQRPQVRALNLLKNRETAPTPDQIDPEVTVEAMLVPGSDRDRWSSTSGGDIVGYVWDVKVGGIETCNCKATDPANRDTHIEIIVDPGNTAAIDRVIVEVTPRWRQKMAAQGIDWSTSKLQSTIRHKWIHVTGWLLFDLEHQNQAENTAPGNPKNWRGTVWEIHPITSMEVVPAP